MHREHHRWHSPPLDAEMGLGVYGHYGAPILAFPTRDGDEWEHEQQGMVDELTDFIDGGRVKFFTVGSVVRQGLLNRQAHPYDRSRVQKQYDDYIRHEVIPFIHDHCHWPGIPITTLGASLGACFAANTLFKYPDLVKRCFALSGVYDLRQFMNGICDEAFYFNNPVDYLPNLSDERILGHLSSCDIHIVTGHGPGEDSSHSYRLSEILSRKGVPHHLDDWGSMGGHDWPFWKHQAREYISRLF